MDAEVGLEESAADVNQCEDRIVSRWREISADDKHEMHEKCDGILRRFGYRIRLLVMERDNSIALYFICLTLAALMSLRHQWRSGQLRVIVKSLFTFLAGTAVSVKRLSWPMTDYERCLQFFSPLTGKPYTQSSVCQGRGFNTHEVANPSQNKTNSCWESITFWWACITTVWSLILAGWNQSMGSAPIAPHCNH